jgi:hypothetical protein
MAGERIDVWFTNRGDVTLKIWIGQREPIYALLSRDEALEVAKCLTVAAEEAEAYDHEAAEASS